MSREEEAKNLRLYDVRTIERTIRKGLLTRKDYEKFLKALPDVTEKAALADISNIDDDDDDDFEPEAEAEGQADQGGDGEGPAA